METLPGQNWMNGRGGKDVIRKIPCVTHGKQLRNLSHESLVGKI